MNDDLPTDEEQDWLIDQTSELISSIGIERYLSAPILEPTPGFFPERWSADERGAYPITRRLVDHAGLTRYAIHIEPFLEAPPDEDDEIENGDEADIGSHETIGYFEGIRDNCLVFGLRLDLLHDAEGLAGVMAHEVAHAFRRAHNLEHADANVEERLTDLTTVCLGAGVLLVRVMERVLIEQDPEFLWLHRSRAGYLDVPSVSFLLALLALARRMDTTEIRRLEKLLDSSAALCFRAAVDALSEEPATWMKRLGVPPRGVLRLPEPPPPRAIQNDRRKGHLWGRITYRAPSRHVWRNSLIGTGIGFGVGIPLFQPPLRIVFIGTCMLLGCVVGWSLYVDRCGRKECGAPIPKGQAECPACAAYIVGELPEPPAAFGTGENRGGKIFRLKKSYCWVFARRAFFPSFALLIIVSGFGVDGAWLVFAPWIVSLVGFVIGLTKRRDLCSDTDCETVLPAGIDRCPRCLGDIAGEIGHLEDRLEAEERAG